MFLFRARDIAIKYKPPDRKRQYNNRVGVKINFLHKGANLKSHTYFIFKVKFESNWAFTVVGPVGCVRIYRGSGLFSTRRAIRGCAIDHQELPCWSSRRIDR